MSVFNIQRKIFTSRHSLLSSFSAIPHNTTYFHFHYYSILTALNAGMCKLCRFSEIKKGKNKRKQQNSNLYPLDDSAFSVQLLFLSAC